MSAKSLPQSLRTEFSLERLSRMFAMNHVHVFWRHDVDYDLDCAIQMSAFEKEHGIRSVYYIRTLGTPYNVNRPEIIAQLDEIRANGHKLGVHVDLRVQRDVKVFTGIMMRRCVEQTRLATFDHENRISFHMPPASALWRKVPNFSSAFEPIWKGRYVADSRGRFLHDLPEDRLATQDQLQIALHPEWWFLPDDEAEELRKQEELRP